MPSGARGEADGGLDRLVKARLLFLCVLLAACGGRAPHTTDTPDAGVSDAGAQPGADAGVATDAGLAFIQACPALNLARCQWLERCGLVSGSEGIDRCVTSLQATWCGASTWPPHVSAGALRYDPLRAAQCVLAFETRDCSAYPALPDVCLSFLKPRVPLGEACFDGYTECTEGVCRGTTCPRFCQTRADLGEPCNAAGDCKSGLVCQTPLLGSMKVCSPASEGGACTTDADCTSDFHCVLGACQPLPTVGEPCLGTRCASVAWCSAQYRCEARKQLDEACQQGQCATGLVCGALGTCESSVAVSGGPCSATQTCPASQFCDSSAGEPGVCTPLLAAGATCRERTWCQAHLTCAGDADAGITCQPRLPLGAPCLAALDCQEGATCLAGLCVALPLAGEDCTQTRTCRVGLCRDSVTDAGALCGALLSAGQSCTLDAQCTSGSCSQGLCLARCVP